MELYKLSCGQYLPADMSDIDLARMTLRESVPGIINSLSDAMPIIQKYLGKRKTEAFLVVFLDYQNKPIGKKIMSEGTEEQTAVYPRNVARECLKRHATRCIIAHNHPTGNTEPSQADRSITVEVKRALETLDISLLDHIIMGNGFYSMRENGLI